ASGTLTFNPGVTSQTITVLVNGNTAFENNETFTVSLTSPTHATITSGTATGTILNDDLPPSLSINNVSQAEGNSGTTSFVFTVTLAATELPTTVTYATADATATTADGDYQATSGTLTFNPGVTSQTITVLVNGNTVSELNETFTVNLSGAVNATIGTASGTGTIVNDDDFPTHFSISAPTATTAGSAFSITVTAQDAGNLTVAGYQGAVHFTSTDGTALLPADYTFTAGDAGVHTFTNGVTLNTSGQQTITATDTAFSTITGNASVTVNQGAAFHFQ